MNAQDEIKKVFLAGLEGSAKKIIEGAKDLAESEKAVLQRAILVAGKAKMRALANEESTQGETADLAYAMATIKRYESITALVAQDFSVNFGKDAAEVAGKVAKSFLSGFLGSIGLPIPL